MLRVRHMPSDYGNRVDIAIIEEKESGERYVAKPLEFVDKTNELVGEPTLSFDFLHFDKEKFSAFFLDWIKIAEDMNLKLNPEFNKEKQAILNHLEDMRQLVFKNKK